MNIGEKLKNKRLEKGISIEEIQKKTKIRTKYLQAIEENNFDIIPGTVYAKAFIKEYARQLNLDEREIIDEYQKIVNVKKVKEIKDNNEEKNDDKNIFKYISVITIVIVLIILSFLLYRMFFKNSGTQEMQKNTLTTEEIAKEENRNIEENEADDSEDAGIQTNDTDKNEELKNGNIDQDIGNESENIARYEDDNTIEVIAENKSWLQVTADGQKVFEDFISPGGSSKFSADEKIELKIGNGAAIKIKSGNKIFGPFGKEEEVIKVDIKLTKEHIN